jgi:dienelactone hydrolase
MEIYLKGNYKSFIKLLVTKSNHKTSNVLVNIHGSYGQSGDKGSKSKELGDLITKNGLAHSVMFNSSRDWTLVHDDDRETMKKAFGEKSFDQELQDLKDTLDLIIDQSHYLFDIPKNKIKIFAVGNSLGGTLVTCLDDYFNYITKIVLAGSGTRTVFTSDLTEEKILANAAKFKGQVLLLQGNLDDTVPLTAGEKLLSGYKNAKKSKMVIEGANHNFSTAREIYIKDVMEFLN